MTTTRAAAQLISNYSLIVSKDENFEISSKNDATFRAISTMLDASFERAYREVTGLLSGDKLIEKAVAYMRNNRTCGGFRVENASLSSLTSFEQMFSVSEFLTQNPNLRKSTRTYAFHFSDDQVVPIWIKKPRNGEASLWTTLVGATTGPLKAPTYEEMTNDDPSNIPGYEIFINPLTCLEIHRNPQRIGALALKSEAFDSRSIDHTWRYQNYDANGLAYLSASAELKGQKSKATRDLVAQSAGFNLAEFIAYDIEHDVDTNILARYNYEDFTFEGYHDDQYPIVTAKDIVATFPLALKGITGPLDNLTKTVLVARLDQSNIRAVNNLVTQTFFPHDKD